MKIHCLGASREVGRSAFVLNTDKRILLDYGIKIFNETNTPEFPEKLDANIDLAVISHAHLDHSGFVPHLYTEMDIPWYSTPPTRDISQILWADSLKRMKEAMPYKNTHIKYALNRWQPLKYGKKRVFGKTEIAVQDAGHILGAVVSQITYNGKKIVYTGDFKVEATRMHEGAKEIEDVDVLMIDSTYALTDHPERNAAEKQLIDEIIETVEEGGTALLPAFAVGRTQELISIIRAYLPDIPIFVDGMGRTICDIYLKYNRLLKNGNTFRKDVRSVRLIRNYREREYATKEPAVIITSAGMMNGGPVLGYLKNINSNSKIILTGYSIEGTNAWKLLNKGYVTMGEFDLEVTLPVEYIDFSAHASRTDILNYIKWANPEKIVVIHSDVAKEFELELREDFGYDAVAPRMGDIIEVG